MLVNIHTHSGVTEGDVLSIANYYEHFERANNGGVCSVGLHPCHLEHYDQNLAFLEQIATLDNLLAIGECGLDTLCNKDEELQMSVFKRQVLLASWAHKPVIIHCVRAFDQLLHITSELQPGVPLIVHGYNKKATIAKQLLDAGMYLSFGAAIMNESSPAAQVLAGIQADRFFLETDDADISIRTIYEQAALLRKTDMETLILQLQHNFKEVFKRDI